MYRGLSVIAEYFTEEEAAALSQAFIKEDEDRLNYLEWQKLLRDREELLRILEKKAAYVKDDPEAKKIPVKKRREMAERFQREAAEVRALLDEMMKDERSRTAP